MFEHLATEVAEALDRLQADYEIEQEVNRGANGVLFFARNRVLGRAVAIKFYQGEPGERQHLEPQHLVKMESPNVLPILYARALSDEWAFFVTPRCDGGDLDDLMERGVSARRALDVVAGICAGVSAMHSSRFLHRDLKPANIVMNGEVPCIADFGSVRHVPGDQDAVRASQHSILYRPPESFGTNSYTRAGDVYQVGVVAYQLLGGTDGTRYLTRRDRRQYEAMSDPIDRQIFIDTVIARRARFGTLLDWRSLPPWAEPARRVLRLMTATDPSVRYQSIGSAAAALSRVRSSIADWQRTAAGARLVTGTRTVDLCQTGADSYDVFVYTGNGPRRMRAWCGRPLDALVEQFS